MRCAAYKYQYKAYKTYNYQAQDSKNGHRENGVQAKQAIHVFGARSGGGGAEGLAGSLIGHGVEAAAAAGIKAVEKAVKHHSRLLS